MFNKLNRYQRMLISNICSTIMLLSLLVLIALITVGVLSGLTFHMFIALALSSICLVVSTLIYKAINKK